MKKIIIALAFLAALTGCTKDKVKGDPKVAKLEAVLNIEKISSDILDCFDITYEYKDFNGKTATKTITAAGKTSFSIDNPGLGEEESCPFTAKLTFTPKEKTDKGSQYDGTISYKLEVNAYYADGSTVTDSGHVINYSSNIPAADLKTLQGRTKEWNFGPVTYKTFFCKTLSGEWHIGVVSQK